VLDVGCGTGTLAIWIKQAVPGVEVIGLDGDPTVLAKAKQKAGALPSKQQTIRQMLCVLKPGGELHVVDFGKPANQVIYLFFSLLRLFDGLANTADNLQRNLPALFSEEGFIDVQVRGEISTLFGTLNLFSADKAQKPSTRQAVA